VRKRWRYDEILKLPTENEAGELAAHPSKPSYLLGHSPVQHIGTVKQELS
jgi:hypothetical protein